MSDPRPCERCLARAARRASWAELADAERIVRLATCGVGEGFCRDGRPPGYDDAGLAERLAAQQLPAGGLLIYGPAGKHKSHLAAARAADAAARGYVVRVASWLQIVADCQRTYSTRGRSEGEILDGLAAADYLALDDLGVGLERRAATDNELRLLFTVMDARYQRGPRQCVTDVVSNLTPAELADAYDARVSRRIAELATPFVMI